MGATGGPGSHRERHSPYRPRGRGPPLPAPPRHRCVLPNPVQRCKIRHTPTGLVPTWFLHRPNTPTPRSSSLTSAPGSLGSARTLSRTHPAPARPAPSRPALNDLYLRSPPFGPRSALPHSPDSRTNRAQSRCRARVPAQSGCCHPNDPRPAALAHRPGADRPALAGLASAYSTFACPAARSHLVAQQFQRAAPFSDRRVHTPTLLAEPALTRLRCPSACTHPASRSAHHALPTQRSQRDAVTLTRNGFQSEAPFSHSRIPHLAPAHPGVHSHPTLREPVSPKGTIMLSPNNFGVRAVPASQ